MELTDQKILLKELERIVEEHGGQRAVERKAKKSTGHLSRVLSGETALCIPSLVEVLDSVGIRFPDFVRRAYEPDPLDEIASGSDPDPTLTDLLRRLSSEARAVDVTAPPCSETGDETKARAIITVAERLDSDRYSDPQTAVQQARALVDEAAKLPTNPIRRAAIAGTVAGILGSCYRLGAMLHEAEWTLQEAHKLLCAADADLATADVLQRIGTVLMDRVEYEAALQVIGRALILYAEHADTASVGRCWVDQGLCLYLDNQLDAARTVFQTALRSLPLTEVRNRTAALHGLAGISHRQGDLHNAEHHLLEAEKCGAQGAYTQAMLVNLRGDLARAAGQLDSAADYYSEARDQLANINPVDAAVAGIDAATMLFDLGRISEAVWTAQELSRIVEPIGKIDTVAKAAVYKLLLTIRRGDEFSRRLLISVRQKVATASTRLAG